MSSLVDARKVAVTFAEGDIAVRRVVDGVTLQVKEGEAMALVGESGCGKTLTTLALARLVPGGGRVFAELLRVCGVDVLRADEKTLQGLRGGGVGFVFQDPSQALNPVLSMGRQVGEAARIHRRLSSDQAREVAATLLAEVGLEDGHQILAAYPHQLSGGQRQRGLIACALSGNPRLLVADEPTSALDTVSAARLLDLLASLQESRGLSLLLVSHDLSLVARLADSVTVLYAGETVEVASREEIFAEPAHPYTRALLDATVARPPGSAERFATIPGSVPRPRDWGSACRFAPRCPRAFDRCRRSRPALISLGGGRQARCFLHSGAELGND